MIINPYAHAGGVVTYEDEVMADSPAAYWKMGESSGAPQDSSGNGHHISSVTGAPTYGQGGIPGSSETSIAVDNGKYFTLSPLPAGLQLTTWTLESWYYRLGAQQAGGAFISEAFSGDLRVRYVLGFNDLNALQIAGGFYDGAWRRYIDNNTPSLNTWYHYVVTYDGLIIRFYRGGIEIGTASYTGTPTGNEGLYLGRRWDNNNSPNGRLAHQAIYSGALSPTRVAAHNAAGA